MPNGRPVLFPFVVMIAFLCVSGCGGGSSSNNTNITSIAITPTAISVGINSQADFTASVNLANSTTSTNTAVTWQVNGTTGGNSTLGTIVSSSTDTNVGIYTAPGVVPTSNNGQVTITAIITVSSGTSSSSSTTITSNDAAVTVTVGQGITVSPTQATVPAGGTYQFSAMLNNVLDSSATWSVSSDNGGDIGSINPTTGLYTAPFAPPPGGSVTITATDATNGTETATATASIIYSDASLRGPFAFSYVGDDATGFRAVAGRFVADGAGTIQSGLEDIDSFGGPVAAAVPILSGTYKVGADGRTSAIVNTSHGSETWQFVLTSTSHALLIRFDSSTTGHGAIDQQNLDALTNSLSVIQGNYVFRAFGGDAQFHPLGVAGRFTADGSGGIPQSASIVDENDNGTVKAADTSLNGSYSFDSANSGTGRGTLTLSSTGTGQLQFAFYIVDSTHLDIIETDQAARLAGGVYAGASGSSFTADALSASNYVFAVGGNSSSGAYAAGGVFTSDAAGNITGGTLDSDNAGSPTADSSISASTYSVDPATSRVDLKLGSMEFAAYPTATNTAVVLELDSTAIAQGTAYLQQPSPAALAGNYALALNGQGIFYSNPGLYQSDAEGEAALTGSTFTSGSANLDINNYGTSPQPSDPIGSSSSIAAPGTNGRGTMTVQSTNPPATYSLVYYVVDADTAVFVGQDSTRVLNGITIRQF
jgi:hypothetical protein